MGYMSYYSKAYTAEELKRLLIQSRIMHDPLSYTLRGNLIVGTVNSLPLSLNACGSYNPGFEENLIEQLKGSGKFNFHTEACYPKGFVLSYKLDEDMYRLYRIRPDTVNLVTSEAITTVNDNVYVDLLKVDLGRYVAMKCPVEKKDLPKNEEDVKMKTKKPLTALLNFVAAATHSKNFIRYMKWISFSDVSLNEAIHTEPFTKAISSGDLPEYCTNLLSSYTRVPTSIQYGCTSEAGLQDNSLLSSTAFDLLYKMWIIGAYNTVLYGIEILRTISKMSDETSQALKDLICLEDPHGTFVDKWLYSVQGGEITPVKEVQDIIDIDDSETRWTAIRNYMRNTALLNEIQSLSTAYVYAIQNTKNFTGIPYYFAMLVEFCADLALRTFRVNYAVELYKLCKANKIDIDDKSWAAATGDASVCTETLRKSESTSVTPETLGSSLSADSVDYSSKEPKTSVKPKAQESKTPTAPTMDALDKARAKYEDAGYEFVVKDVVSKDCDESARDKYEKIADCAKLVNRRLIKQLKEIKTYNTGGKCPGLKTGKLDRKNVYRYRTSKDIFYKNTYKTKESDLAFGIVLDASGSMCGRGIEDGRVTMIVLHETLKALGINHSIITHTSEGRHNCVIRRFQAFKEDKTYKVCKNYALSDIKAYTGNCDSGALYYMEQALLRVRNKDKFCIIFSDGQPTECSGVELKDQVAHMERNGIRVIGIGIGFPEIREYYQNYANGKNLKEMLDIVTKILKQYVLDKKD